MVDGIRFYESQETGLGAYFLNSIMSDLRSLSVYAGSHQKYDTKYYRMVCKRFPYLVYYRLEVAEVHVYAILDERRDPFFIERTLKNIGAEE